MNEIETAWVAGIIEGEGYIAHGQRSYKVVVSMTDFDVIEKLLDATGVGQINGPYTNKGNRKPYLRWSVTRKKDTVAVLEAILPHLGSRRSEQAQVVLDRAKVAKRPGKGVAREGNRWRAYGKTRWIKGLYKQPYLGLYSTEEEALQARAKDDLTWLSNPSVCEKER